MHVLDGGADVGLAWVDSLLVGGRWVIRLGRVRVRRGPGFSLRLTLTAALDIWPLRGNVAATLECGRWAGVWPLRWSVAAALDWVYERMAKGRVASEAG